MLVREDNTPEEISSYRKLTWKGLHVFTVLSTHQEKFARKEQEKNEFRNLTHAGRSSADVSSYRELTGKLGHDVSLPLEVCTC